MSKGYSTVIGLAFGNTSSSIAFEKVRRFILFQACFSPNCESSGETSFWRQIRLKNQLNGILRGSKLMLIDHIE
jgi:hypothetical protein